MRHFSIQNWLKKKSARLGLICGVWKFTCHFTIMFKFEHSHSQPPSSSLPLSRSPSLSTRTTHRNNMQEQRWVQRCPRPLPLGARCCLHVVHCDSTSPSRRMFSTPSKFFFSFPSFALLTYLHFCTHTGMVSATAAAASRCALCPLHSVSSFLFFFTFLPTWNVPSVPQNRHRLDNPTDHSAVGAAARQSMVPPRASTRQAFDTTTAHAPTTTWDEGVHMHGQARRQRARWRRAMTMSTTTTTSMTTTRVTGLLGTWMAMAMVMMTTGTGCSSGQWWRRQGWLD